MAKNWAICVGINQYRFLQDLTCAVNDAEKMHVWLKETAKFEQTYLFTDTSPEIDDMSEPLPSQPTFTTLRRWLRKRFERPILSPSDSLWFFFSGYGVRVQGKDYLLLSDSDPYPEEVNNSAISLAFVTEQLRQSGAGNIMMFVDACRHKDESDLGIELQPEQGIIFIASCSPGEKSYEIEALNHGSFTYALLECLQIQGKQNCATVERLCKRLKDRVAEINREYYRPKQTPYITIEPETKNYLIFLPDRIQPTLNDMLVSRIFNKQEFNKMSESFSLLNRQLKLFLCLGSEDKPAVRQLYNNLISIGIDAWLDEEKILPGQDWQYEISKAVRNSDIIVICLSSTSVNKTGYVQKEIKYALDIAEEKPEGTIFLIPARLENCSVPDRLSGKQWVNLFEEKGFERLLKSLEAYLKSNL